MIKGQFSTEGVSSNSTEAFSLCEKSRLGEKVGGKIEYLFVEALFLMEQQKMEIFQAKNKLNFENILKKIKKIDKNIETKLIVYRDLRKKGYIAKTALKFGAEFRIYDRGIKPGQDHAKWIMHIAKENENLKWHDFAAKNRIAHSTKKNLLLAIVDEEKDVSYYEISWKRL